MLYGLLFTLLHLLVRQFLWITLRDGYSYPKPTAHLWLDYTKNKATLWHNFFFVSLDLTWGNGYFDETSAKSIAQLSVKDGDTNI